MESSAAAAATALSDENFAQGCVKAEVHPDATMSPITVARAQLLHFNPAAVAGRSSMKRLQRKRDACSPKKTTSASRGPFYGWICLSDIHSLIVFGGGGGSGWSIDLKKPGLSAGFGLFAICTPVVPLLRTVCGFFGVSMFLVPVTICLGPVVSFVTTLGVLPVLETFFVLAGFDAELLHGSQLLPEDESDAACKFAAWHRITETMSDHDLAIFTGRTPAEGTPQERPFFAGRCHDAGRRIAK
jgi:hypothetical protein